MSSVRLIFVETMAFLLKSDNPEIDWHNNSSYAMFYSQLQQIVDDEPNMEVRMQAKLALGLVDISSVKIDLMERTRRMKDCEAAMWKHFREYQQRMFGEDFDPMLVRLKHFEVGSKTVA